MTAARDNLMAGLAIVRRDAEIFLSYRASAVTPIFSAVFAVTLFHFISRLVHARAVGSPDAYFAYVIVGLAIFGVVTSAISLPPNTLRQELVAGTFERLMLSSFGPARAIVALLGFPLLRSVILAVVSIAFAAVAFGLSIRWPGALLAIPVGVLAALAFAPFGIAASACVLVFKRSAGVVAAVLAAVSLFAGVYFPVSLLPGWIAWASNVQPFTPAVDLLRHLMVGTPMRDAAWLDLAKLLGFTFVLIPLAALLVQQAVRIGRQRGTIIEY